MKKIKIELADNIIEAELNNTKTANELLKKLPIQGNINRWGNEVYFQIPVEGCLEEGKEVLNEGSLAFWPPGNAFCIFFGPTPMSTDEHPKAASPVTEIGKILNKSDLKVLNDALDGQKIILSL